MTLCSCSAIRSSSRSTAPCSSAAKARASARVSSAAKSLHLVGIGIPPSIGKLKSNSAHRHHAPRAAVLGGGTEADAGGGLDGIFVQPVSQAPHDAHNPDAAGSAEESFQYYFSFDLQPARFLGIGRTGLLEDFERRETAASYRPGVGSRPRRLDHDG